MVHPERLARVCRRRMDEKSLRLMRAAVPHLVNDHPTTDSRGDAFPRPPPLRCCTRHTSQDSCNLRRARLDQASRPAESAAVASFSSQDCDRSIRPSVLWRTRLMSAVCMAPTTSGAAAAPARAISHTGTANAALNRPSPYVTLRPRGACPSMDQCALAVVSGGTTNGTTCSRDSKLARYCVAACCVGNGPILTRYQVPRPATRASKT